MKSIKAFIFLGLLTGIFVISPAFAQNPILTHKYTADPNAFIWNDRVYVYASFDNDNPRIKDGGYDIKEYTLISSDDMANWTDHGEVFQVKRDMRWANQAYAPGAAVKNNKVYLYVPDGGASIGVVYADRPEGPFTDPNGKTMIAKNSQNNTNVPWLFDPAAFVDDDGKAYIYFGGGDTGAGSNLRGAELNDDMTSVKFPATTIADTRRSFEAAFVHKENGKYYFSYSTNFSGGPGAAMDYAMSNNPLTGFTYTGTMFTNPSVNGGNNHAHPVKYKDKWYLFYHDRRLKRLNNIADGELRSVSFGELKFNTDSTMIDMAADNNMPAQIKNFNPYQTIIASTFHSTGQSTGFQVTIPDTTNGKREVILGGISDGSYTRLKGVDFGAGASGFTVRAASNSGGGSVEIRTGSATGTLAGTCNITSTGSWTAYRNFECDVTGLTGVKDYVYFVFKGTGEPFRLASYKFEDSPPIEETCNEYDASFCGNRVLYADILSDSDTMPTEGQCLFIEDFTKIQPNLNSTVSINGVENTCGDEWGEFEGGCMFNTKPTLKNGGYYVYVKSGSINTYAPEEQDYPNGWQGIRAGVKPPPPCESVPIIRNPQPVLNSGTPRYYSLKGEPLGSTKPQRAGIYIVKQGSSVQKIVVK